MNASSLNPILIVEDCDEDYATIIDALSLHRVGYPVIRAETADRALAALVHGRIALVILDNSLPGNHGVDFLRFFRTQEMQRGVPVVAFTGVSRVTERDELWRAGISSFHIKQVDYAQNLETLRKIFQYWLNDVAE